MFKVRVCILIGALALVLLTILGRLGYLQIIRGAHYDGVLDLRTRPAVLLEPAERGAIADRFGRILASDLPSLDLAVIARNLRLEDVKYEDIRAHQEKFDRFRKQDPAPPAAETEKARAQLYWNLNVIRKHIETDPWVVDLARYTGRDRETIAKNLIETLHIVARGWERDFKPVTFLRKIPESNWTWLLSQQEDEFRNPKPDLKGEKQKALKLSRTIEAEADPAPPKAFLPGLVCTHSSTRSYPYGAFLAHVLGFIGELGKDDLPELKQYGSLLDYRSARIKRWKEMQAGFTAEQTEKLTRLLGQDPRCFAAWPELLLRLDAIGFQKRHFAARWGLQDPVRWAEEAPRPPRMQLCEAEKAWLDPEWSLPLRRAGQAVLVDQVIGVTGVERWYNEWLRGKHGLLLKARSASKPDHQDPPSYFNDAGPQDGRTLSLTINAAFQQVCGTALKVREETGPAPPAAIVILDCHSGEVLAMASYPDFDPNLFVPPRTNMDQYEALVEDPQKPFVNRCISDHYPLGSVMKALIASVALEEGLITPATTVVCTGSKRVGDRTFSCDGGRAHGAVNVTEALRRSCNVFFFQLGMSLGLKRIQPYARKVGFGRRLGIDLPGEQGGRFPDPFTVTNWRPGDDCLVAIGQGPVAVTVLQAACLMATVANGGHPVTPRLQLQAQPGPEAAALFSCGTLSVVRQGLEEVVSAGTPGQRGTAYSAFQRDVEPLAVSVAGKTGTADVGTREAGVEPHAWFAGYAPVDKPHIAFCVFVQHGGHGGEIAAPIAYQVLRRLYGTASEPVRDPSRNAGAGILVEGE